MLQELEGGSEGAMAGAAPGLQIRISLKGIDAIQRGPTGKVKATTSSLLPGDPAGDQDNLVH
jgi:hypothetical protein